MKDRKYYEAKIAVLKADVELYELRLRQLDTPKELKPTKEKTKSISFRVPYSEAEICKMKIYKLLSDTDFFRAYPNF